VDQLDCRPAFSGRTAGPNLRAVVWLGLVGVLLVGTAACGQNGGLPKLGSSGGTTVAAGSVPASPLLAPTSTCPLTAAAVASVVGVSVHEEVTVPAGSCAFDSTAGGQGLEPSEIRVNIQTGPNDLASLYRFFAQESSTGQPSCQPFEVIRRPDLGAGAFETACGATATLGPSSADDYLPTQNSGQLTVTVNRGLDVGDHRLAACKAETEAILGLIRKSW